MAVIFVSCGLLALTFCLIQIRHRNEIVLHLNEFYHLFELIINRSIEREREMQLCMLPASAHLSTNNEAVLVQKQQKLLILKLYLQKLELCIILIYKKNIFL